MSKWFKFASCNKVSPVEPPAQISLTFLTSLVMQGNSFNQMRMARNALVNQQENVSFGNISIFKRYIKEILEDNPTFPKFQFTWNVSLLFDYFHNMKEIHALDIQKLAQKLVMLMTLISGSQRAHTSLLNYVPFVPTCLTCLRVYVPHVPMRLTCLRAFLPQITTFLRALNFYVSTCLRVLNYHVPTCLKLLLAYVLTCFTFLHASKFYVPTCLRALSACVP